MLKEALNLPTEVKNYFEWGRIALTRENYDYAIELFTKSLSIKMDFASARYLLRKAEQRKFKKNPPSSLKNICAKTSCLMLFLKALYQERQNPVEAIATYERCLKSDPFNIGLSNRLAAVLLNKNMQESAIKVLEASLPISRKNIFALKKLADFYAEKKDFRKARIFLEETLAYFPEDQEAYKKLKDLEASETISKIST